MRYTVKKEILEAIANYLGKRPFEEVHMLVKALQKDLQPEQSNTPPREVTPVKEEVSNEG